MGEDLNVSRAPGPQLVAIRLKETQAANSIEDLEPVHIEFNLSMNATQREIYNVLIYYTKNNGPLRTMLIGIMMAYGAAAALTELRKSFPNIEISSINVNRYAQAP